jgi:DNA polymerase III epsilon subunit-like protein
MIVVDLECSGDDYEKCGIVEIGAVDIDNPKNSFCECARISENETIVNNPNASLTVLDVLGMTEEELRDEKKQTEKELLENFFNWCIKNDYATMICQHPQFDVAFLEHRARKNNVKFPISYKALDLHTLAQLKWFEIHNEFSLIDDFSSIGLKTILEFAGMQDNRNAHNALEDAKLEAECFYRLVYGKNLFEEYNEFPIPDYLLKSDQEKSDDNL